MKSSFVHNAAVSALLMALLAGCGGGGSNGGGSGSSDPGPGAPGTAALSGTYTLTTGGAVKGSFMLDKDGAIAVCAVGTDPSCTAKVTQPSTAGGSTSFALLGNSSGAKASGTIAANGTVAAELIASNGAATPLVGSKVSENYVDCAAPFTREGGQCQPPASAVIVIAPTIKWAIRLIPLGGGRIYTMLFCYGDSCEAISPEIAVTREDLADEETPEIIAYAESVAKEFQNIIARLFTAKTYPKQLAQIFRRAVHGAIESERPNAVESAVSALTAAGFPAAAPGGQSSGPSGTGPTAASACAEQSYPGDTSEPQVYFHDKYAQFLSCLYKATGDQTHVVNGNKECGLLDNFLKGIPNRFTPLFCTGPKLKL